MTDLIVVGAGFWGVATALLAERRGLTVTLIDSASQYSGSRAASGYASLDWFKGEQRQEASWSLSAAREHGVVLRAGVTLVRTGFGSDRKISAPIDWRVFDPVQWFALRRPDIVCTVQHLVGRRVVLAPPSGGTEAVSAARGVVVCAGVWTDRLLALSGLQVLGVKSLPGSAAFYEGNHVGDRVVLHGINPYRHYAIRSWPDGTTRVCATLEKRGVAHRQQYVDAMCAAVQKDLGPGASVVRRIVSGERPMLEDGPTAKLVDENVVAASGGGRVGASLAFWYARRSLELLGL